MAKYLDHLPLCRQERIFERAGLAIARSTLAQWVGECGAQPQTIANWVAQAAIERGNPLPGKEALTSAEREELTRLRRENPMAASRPSTSKECARQAEQTNRAPMLAVT